MRTDGLQAHMQAACMRWSLAVMQGELADYCVTSPPVVNGQCWCARKSKAPKHSMREMPHALGWRRSTHDGAIGCNGRHTDVQHRQIHSGGGSGQRHCSTLALTHVQRGDTVVAMEGTRRLAAASRIRERCLALAARQTNECDTCIQLRCAWSRGRCAQLSEQLRPPPLLGGVHVQAASCAADLPCAAEAG